MTHGGNVWQGEHPEKWLDFSANIRAEGVPGWVWDAIKGAMAHIGYYPDVNMAAARRGLAASLGLPSECVLPTSGGIAAIELACHTGPGDALIFDPAFIEYERVSVRHGLSIRRVSLLSSACCFGTLLSIAQENLTKGITVWLNNPNNPIGCAFDRAEVVSLLDAVEAIQGRLIVDEAFIDYCPEHSVADLVVHHPSLVVVGSLTKTLGIPGIRLGYLCAHPSVRMQIESSSLPWQLNCFAAAIAAECADHPALRVEDALANARCRAAMAQGLKAIGAFVYPSRANYLLAAFARPVGPVARQLRRENILVRQCMNFQGIDDGYHLRLAVKRTRENEKLLSALGVILCQNT